MNKITSITVLIVLLASTASANVWINEGSTSFDPQNPESGEQVSISFSAETDDRYVDEMGIRLPDGDWQMRDCGISQCGEADIGSWEYTPSSSGDKEIEFRATSSNFQAEEARTTDTLSVSSAGDAPSVDISNIRSTDSNIEEGESTELKVDLEPDQNIGYLEVDFKSDGNVLATEQVYDLYAYNEETVTSESLSWSDLSDQLNTGQDHDVEVEISNAEFTDSSTASNVFTLAEAEDEDPSVDISNIRSTDSDIEEGESTEFKADVTPNQDIGYLEVSFTSGGGQLGSVQEYNLNGDSTTTITVDSDWESLSGDLSTGQDHDLTVEAGNSDFDVSETANDAFYLGEEVGASVDVANIRSTDTEIQEGENTEFKADLTPNEYLGYLEVEFKSNGNVLDTQQLYGVSGGSETTVTSSVLSWSDLTGQLDTDEDLDLEISLSNEEIGDSVSEQNVFTLVSSETAQTLEITDLRSTNTDVDEGEDTEFEAEISPNQDIGYLEVDFYVNGEVVAENQQYNLEDGRSQTISSTLSWQDLADSLDTGQDYDLEVRVNNEATDLSSTESDAFYLADADEDDVSECQTFEDSDLDPDLEDYDATPQEGNDYDATAILNNNADSDVDGDMEIFVKDSDESISCDHYQDDTEDFIDFADGSVSPSAGSSDSFDFDYSGTPVDDLDFDETYVLMARFDDGQTEYLGSIGSINWEQTEDGSQEPNADFSWSPSQPMEGQQVNFDASDSMDPDGDIAEYTWHFGDGSDSETGVNTDHTYTSTGDYDVQLVVEDDEGNSDSVTRTVPVVEDPSACSVSVGSLNFEDRIIDRGESTTSSISVSNLGEQQAFNIEFKVGGDTVSTEEASIDADSQETFSAVVSPRVDSIVTADVTSDGDPCGSRINEQRHRELVVIAGRGPGETTSSLEVNVRNDDGRRLSDARVELEGGTNPVRFTGSQGEAYFELAQDSYEMTVSKSGYQTDYRTVEVDSSDQSIDVVLDRADSDSGTLTALVEDNEGNRIQDAQVTAENGDDITVETNSDGRASMILEQGEYTVTASRSGYGTRVKSVDIESGEETTEVFRLSDDDDQGLEISDVSYPSSVCRGDTLTTEVTIDNNVGFHEFVSLTGTGLGSINSLSSFSLDEDESVTKTIRFTNVQGSGNEEFTLTANNQDSDTVTRTVTVDSCPVPEAQTPSGISMTLSYSQQPNIAVYGDIIKVRGFVDGVRGRTNVDIEVGDETKASVNTRPDGYYETWITADNVGSQTVTARSGQATASRPLRVIPTSTVTGIEAPVSAFEGQTYEVCAQVDSQIEPEVILERDGEVVTSKRANGRVCFEREAREPGTHNYRIAALTSGSSNTASTNVEVLEMDVEASSFPNQIASVESGSGLVKVDLYNTNENQTTYDLTLEGLPDNWISQSEKQVILDKGERKTVYFYLTPQEEGSYRPSIVVQSEGSEIYDEEISVITGGTTESMKDEGSVLDRFVEGLRGLFSF